MQNNAARWSEADKALALMNRTIRCLEYCLGNGSPHEKERRELLQELGAIKATMIRGRA